MDLDEFRSILSRSRVGIWTLIDTAIKVAASDHGEEFVRRRDKIVQSLYAPATCRRCDGKLFDDVARDQPSYPDTKIGNDRDNKVRNDENDDDDDDDDKLRNSGSRKIRNDNRMNLNEDLSKSPLTPESNHRNMSGGGDDDDVDPFGCLFDDEQTTILSIKEQLEDPQQSEDSIVELLQSLADMDITFQALKETDIGRPVNRLRKHSSNEVRILVKQLVRKWKETVDDWVKINQPEATSDLIADEDSPQKNTPKNQPKSHQQVPDFGYSPNPQNGNSSVERNRADYQKKTMQTQPVPRRDTPPKPPQSSYKSSSAPPPSRAQRGPVIDDERLDSARRRLQENYQEAENAKRQRTVQMVDIHEIPKPKKAFFAKNKSGFQGRHH